MALSKVDRCPNCHGPIRWKRVLHDHWCTYKAYIDINKLWVEFSRRNYKPPLGFSQNWTVTASSTASSIPIASSTSMTTSAPASYTITWDNYYD